MSVIYKNNFFNTHSPINEIKYIVFIKIYLLFNKNKGVKAD